MVIALTLEPFDYVAESDRKAKPDVTHFSLRVLNAPEFQEVNDMMLEGGAKSIGWVNKALEYGLCGWSNLGDGKGGEVKFAGDKMGCISKIPGLVRMELANEIAMRSQLNEDQEKN